MKTFVLASIYAASLANALCEVIQPDFAIIEEGSTELDLYSEMMEAGDQLSAEQLLTESSEIIILPEPTADTNEEAEKPPGLWSDEQKLTVDTFKEIVTTDVDNVWVIAYIDPRCRDCLSLSVEWEKLTQIEEKEKRKIKLGYVDISVTENWQIIQDHTKGKKLTHTPAVTLYGDNKESPYWFPKD